MTTSTRRTASASTAPTAEAIIAANGTYIRMDPSAGELLGKSSSELIGAASQVALPSEANEVWWTESPTESNPGVTYRLTRQPTESAPWRLTMVHDDGGQSRPFTDFTELLLEIAQEPDLETTVRQLTYQFERRTGLLGCAIVLMEESGDPIFAGGDVARRGQLAAMVECRRRGAPMTMWQGFHENRVVVERHWMETAFQDDRFAPIRPFLHDPADGDVKTGSFTAIPLRLGGRPIGVIAGGFADAEPVTAERVHLWTELAFEITLALRYSAAIRDARLAGADLERQRLNEDLHDTVSQDLFALSLLTASAAEDLASTAEPRVLEEMQELRTLTEQISTGVRALIVERRQVRSDATLTERLRRICEDTGKRAGIDIHVIVDEEWNDLNTESTDDVVRIVQEALRNIVKHARATTAAVRLGVDPSDATMLIIEIVDDGVEFDPGLGGPDSFGLASIKERVSQQGGSVEIHTAPRKTLRVRMLPRFASEWDAVRHER